MSSDTSAGSDTAELVDRFFAYATDEPLTMHVSYDGSTEIVADDGSANEEFRISGEMDAAGEDFAGTISINSQDETTNVEVVRVDDESYVRPEGSAWQVVDDDGSQPVSPFVALQSAAEIEYVGEADWQGQTMQQLWTATWLGDDPASMESDTLRDVELVDHTFDIFATADRPPPHRKVPYRQEVSRLERSIHSPVGQRLPFDDAWLKSEDEQQVIVVVSGSAPWPMPEVASNCRSCSRPAEHPSQSTKGATSMVTCTDWTAWYNRMPGADDAKLHIAGKVECESASIELRLDLDNEGIVDEPDLIALRLTATEPDAGDTQWIVKDVGWRDDVGQDIGRVRIQGDCQAEVPVTIAR